MTKGASIDITRGRLDGWQKQLARDESIFATPALLICLCHDEAHLGSLSLTTTADLAPEMMIGLLLKAAQMIREGLTEGGAI